MSIKNRAPSSGFIDGRVLFGFGIALIFAGVLLLFIPLPTNNQSLNAAADRPESGEQLTDEQNGQSTASTELADTFKTDAENSPDASLVPPENPELPTVPEGSAAPVNHPPELFEVPDPIVPDVAFIAVRVNEFEPSNSIALKLEQEGVIDSAEEFNKYLESQGFDLKIQIGTHQFNQNMSYQAAAEELMAKR